MRKMGGGMKCSLRFFTDGRVLRPTCVHVRAGFSNNRLGNVMGILTDLGILAVEGGKTVVTERGRRLRDKL